jgi:hypothetical protein
MEELIIKLIENKDYNSLKETIKKYDNTKLQIILDNFSNNKEVFKIVKSLQLYNNTSSLFTNELLVSSKKEERSIDDIYEQLEIINKKLAYLEEKIA